MRISYIRGKGRSVLNEGVAKSYLEEKAVGVRQKDPANKMVDFRRRGRGGTSREETEEFANFRSRPVANVECVDMRNSAKVTRKTFVDVVKGTAGVAVGHARIGRREMGRQTDSNAAEALANIRNKTNPLLHNNRERFNKEGNPAVSFSVSEIQMGSKKFENSLVLRFQKGRPPAGALKRLISLSWKVQGRYSFSEVWDGEHVLVNLEREKDLKAAMAFPVRSVGSFGFRLFKWSVDYDPSAQQNRKRVWIRLPNLPVWAYDRVFAEIIVSSFARLIKLDDVSESCVNLKSMRICVEVEKLKAVPEKIWIELPNGSSYWQVLQVEGHWCSICRLTGHRARYCGVNRLEAGKEKEPANENGPLRDVIRLEMEENKELQKEGGVELPNAMKDKCKKKSKEDEWHIVNNSKRKKAEKRRKKQEHSTATQNKVEGCVSGAYVGPNLVIRSCKEAGGIGDLAVDSLKINRAKKKTVSKGECHVSKIRRSNIEFMEQAINEARENFANPGWADYYDGICKLTTPRFEDSELSESDEIVEDSCSFVQDGYVANSVESDMSVPDVIVDDSGGDGGGDGAGHTLEEVYESYGVNQFKSLSSGRKHLRYPKIVNSSSRDDKDVGGRSVLLLSRDAKTGRTNISKVPVGSKHCPQSTP